MQNYQIWYTDIFGLVWLGLVSLYNGLSIYVGYLISKLSLSNDSQDITKSIAEKEEDFSYLFWNRICIYLPTSLDELDVKQGQFLIWV